MGISNLSVNIRAMIAQKNSMNAELMKIQDNKAAITAEIDHKMATTEDWYKDESIKRLQSKEDAFQEEIDQMETKLQAIEANLETLQKEKSENIKADAPQLSL